MELCRQAITFIDIMINNIPSEVVAEKTEFPELNLSKKHLFSRFDNITSKSHFIVINKLFTTRCKHAEFINVKRVFPIWFQTVLCS